MISVGSVRVYLQTVVEHCAYAHKVIDEYEEEGGIEKRSDLKKRFVNLTKNFDRNGH